MNVLFPLLFLLSTLLFCATAPSGFLPAALLGAEKAGLTAVGLLASYTLFFGLAELMEQAGISTMLARALKPVIFKLFRLKDEECAKAIALNLSGNMLGISGMATPMGQRAACLLEKLPEREYNHTVLFVVNATSIQLMPTTVLSLLSAGGAQNPYAVLLPSLLATGFSTAVGLILVQLLYTMPAFKRQKPCN